MKRARAWYLDAWCVVDGLAFASHRLSGDPHSATTTVYVAAPGFDPETVGSVTTALTATRGIFQAGLYSQDGEEVPFSSLDEVRELVRRAYVAGGTLFRPNPGAAPAAALPLQPRPDEGSGGAALRIPELRVELSEIWKRDIRPTLARISPTMNRDPLRDGIGRLLAEARGDLRLLAESATRSLIDSMGDAGAPDSAHRLATLDHWIHAFGVLGLDDGHRTTFVVTGKEPSERIGWLTMPRTRVADGHWISDISSPGSRRRRWSALFDMPIPRDWAAAEPAYTGRSEVTFGHALAIALADRLALENMTLHGFLTIAFTSLVLIGTGVAESIVPGGLARCGENGAHTLRTTIRRRVSHWLAMSLPDTRLSGHAAEHAIAEIVDRSLPVPATPPPRSHGPGPRRAPLRKRAAGNTSQRTRAARSAKLSMRGRA